MSRAEPSNLPSASSKMRRVGDLGGYVLGLFLTVAAADAEEDDEAAADCGNGVALHGDGGAGYALDECPQGVARPSSRRRPLSSTRTRTRT